MTAGGAATHALLVPGRARRRRHVEGARGGAYKARGFAATRSARALQRAGDGSSAAAPSPRPGRARSCKGNKTRARSGRPRRRRRRRRLAPRAASRIDVGQVSVLVAKHAHTHARCDDRGEAGGRAASGRMPTAAVSVRVAPSTGARPRRPLKRRGVACRIGPAAAGPYFRAAAARGPWRRPLLLGGKADPCVSRLMNSARARLAPRACCTTRVPLRAWRRTRPSPPRFIAPEPPRPRRRSFAARAAAACRRRPKPRRRAPARRSAAQPAPHQPAEEELRTKLGSPSCRAASLSYASPRSRSRRLVLAASSPSASSSASLWRRPPPPPTSTCLLRRRLATSRAAVARSARPQRLRRRPQVAPPQRPARLGAPSRQRALGRERARRHDGDEAASSPLDLARRKLGVWLLAAHGALRMERGLDLAGVARSSPTRAQRLCHGRAFAARQPTSRRPPR